MCAGGPGRIPRPRWGLLYGLVILSLAGLGVEQVIVSPGALRTVAGATLALAVFATMALWVRVNRVALDQQEACDCAWEKVTVRVVMSRRPAPAGFPLPPRRRLTAYSSTRR